MIRLVVLVLAWGIGVGLCASADEPKKLQWQRVLTGDDAQTAANLQTQMVVLEAADDYAGAIKSGEELLALRTKVQGEDHHQTVSLKHQVGSLRTIAAAPAEKRTGWRAARSGTIAAVQLEAKGRYAQALSQKQTFLKWCQELLGEEHPNTATGYNNVAFNLAHQGKYAEAQPLYQKALEIYRKALGEEHPDTANSYSNVAANLNDQGKYAEAQPLYQKALDIRRKVLGEEHPDTALSYNGMAVNLASQGKYAEAQPLFQKALDIRRKALGEEHAYTGKSYGNVAANLAFQGKYAEAQPLAQKALDIRRKALGEEHPDTALNCINVAANLAFQGKYAEAQLLAQKALDINRKVLGEDHPDTALSYTNLAINLIAQGKQAEAEMVLQRGVPSYESSRLAGASGLDRATLRNFNPRLLLAVIQQARDPNDAWRSVELTLARGLLDQQAAQNESPLTPAERAEQTTDRNRVAALQPQVLALVTKPDRTDAETASLGALLAARREAEERLAAREVAVSLRQVADLDAIRESLPADAALLFWVDLYSQTEAVQEHWVCAVRSTGGPKWERLPALNPMDLEPTGGSPEVLSTLPKPYAVVIALVALATALLLAWRLRPSRAATMNGPPRPTGKRLLRGGSTAVALLLAVAVFVLVAVIHTVRTGDPLDSPPDGPRTAIESRTGPGPKWTAEDAALPENLLNALARPAPQAGIEKRVEQLRVQRIVPVLTHLDGVRTLYVVPAGDMAGVPVELLTPALTVSYVPSGTFLARAKAKAPPTGQRMLALGDPIFARPGEDIPGTRVETNRLRQLLGASCKVLTDSAASEQSLDALRRSGELAKFRYLHFATHGKGNSVRAFESVLILAQDRLPKGALPKAGEPFINGQLSALEVLEFWKLDAELVTLSACETAVGKASSGDGLLGFAQAFLTAGSRSVCLSLWKVDDTATALLMDRFYQNLLGKREGLAEPMRKAVALDEAKRWLRNLSGTEVRTLIATLTKGLDRGDRGPAELPKPVPFADPNVPVKDSKPYDHPRYWAAFVLIGDPN